MPGKLGFWSVGIGTLAFCALFCAPLIEAQASGTGTSPLAKVVVDRNENLWFDCRPINATDLPTILRTWLANAKPSARIGEALVEGDSRFQTTQNVLQQFDALSIHQVRFGVGVAGVSILCNENALPGFFVDASITPARAPRSALGANVMHVDIAYDGQLSIDGAPGTGNGQFVKVLETALARTRNLSLEVQPNRLAKYGELMWVLLVARQRGVRAITVYFGNGQ